MARDNLLRAAQRKTAIGPSDLDGFAERLLLKLPMFLTVAVGLIYMVGRFIALLKANLKEPPDNLASVALLAMTVAAAAAMVTFACVSAGAVIGLKSSALASASGYIIAELFHRCDLDQA